MCAKGDDLGELEGVGSERQEAVKADEDIFRVVQDL